MTGRRAIAAAAMAAGLGALAAAFAFQHLGGLDPCVLCVYQRWPHAVTVLLAGLALLGGRHASLALAAAGLTALAGAGLAGFHVGVEQKWWAGTAACGSVGGADTVEALREQLAAAPAARCDEVPWSLFGLSMASYNGLLSLALGTFILAGVQGLRRGRET